MELSLIAGGVGVLIVFGVVGRARFQSARRIEESALWGPERMSPADPFDDEPNCEPIDDVVSGAAATGEFDGDDLSR